LFFEIENYSVYFSMHYTTLPLAYQRLALHASVEKANKLNAPSSMLASNSGNGVIKNFVQAYDLSPANQN